MEIIIVDKEYFRGNVKSFSSEKHYYPNTLEEVSAIPRGHFAKKIILNDIVIQSKDDLVHLIDFLRTAEPCFP